MQAAVGGKAGANCPKSRACTGSLQFRLQTISMTLQSGVVITSYTSKLLDHYSTITCKLLQIPYMSLLHITLTLHYFYVSINTSLLHLISHYCVITVPATPLLLCYYHYYNPTSHLFLYYFIITTNGFHYFRFITS